MPGESTSPTPTSVASTGDVFVVGVDHRTCPTSLRERLFLSEAALPEFLAGLRAAGLNQALVVSTCDRTEVVGWHGDSAQAVAQVARHFAAFGAFNDAELAALLAIRHGPAAVEHVFAVAASLESAIVGEPQVLGQVREAYHHAAAAGLIGGDLDRLMQGAFAAAKRVRTETTIGERAVSITAAALQVAREVHGALDRRAALFVGAGEMAEMFADKLREAGVTRFLVADSLAVRAQTTAKRLNAHVYGLNDLESAVAEADIVLCALGRGSIVVGPDLVRAALRRRRQRPLFLIDAAVPGDIAPAVNDVEEAFLYSLDDLENVARAGRAKRDEAAADAWGILRASVADHLRAAAARDAAPAIAALRAHFEATRARLLADQPTLSAEEATRLLINRLLHKPSEALRDLAAKGESTEILLGRLFGLSDHDRQ